MNSNKRNKRRQKISRSKNNQWLTGRTRRSSRWKLARRMLLISIGLILLTAAVTIHINTGLRLPRGTELALIRQADNTMMLVWPEARGANAYDVEVSDEDGEIFKDRVQSTQCVMPLVNSGKLKIQVQPVRENTRWGNMTIKEGNVFRASCEIVWPTLNNFRINSEKDNNVIQFLWEGGTGYDIYLMFHVDADGIYHQVVQSTFTKEVSFGEDGDYPLPDYEETYSFVGCAGKKGSGVIVCSEASAPLTFERSDFFGSVIDLRYTENGDNVYTFAWNETKGDSYELQYQSDYVSEWTAVQQVALDAGNTCTVRLRSGTNYRLRMVAIDGEAPADDGKEHYAAQSQEVALTTGISVTYATIWPQKDLTVYSDVERKNAIGTAKAATAYCVLEETNGLFRIHTAEGYGYVDSTFCMINLADYIGELCYYNITNSYSSIFTVHGYALEGLTGTVIPGFENVQIDAEQSKPDEFLVPLLYPSAQKLANAAQAVQQENMRLKIYEAYRPRRASTYMYTTAERQLNNPLPDSIYGGGSTMDAQPNREAIVATKMAEAQAAEEAAASAQPDATENGISLAELEMENTAEGVQPQETPAPEGGEAAETAPAPQPEPTPDPAPEAAPETETPASTAANPTPQEEPVVDVRASANTYYSLMTNNGKYRLGSFLAQSGSTHNLGIAVDITLVDANGVELGMQTAIHDLSYFATTDKNNASANLLRKYMTEAGFATLITEWWHFQDDDTRYGKGVKTYLEQGVSPEGWVKDDQGWKYRSKDGTYVKNASMTIGGQSYDFDAAGYANVDW